MNVSGGVLDALSAGAAMLAATTIVPEESSEDDDICVPLSSPTATILEQCQHVMQSEACQGGGYMQWAAFIACSESEFKWLLVIASIFFLLILFSFISIAADDFFSPNVSVVASHLRISQTFAGVTIVAFGNGSPDIFTSIASVLSTSHPKAGLALGSLLGGCIFVTLVVGGSVVLVRPFKAALWSTLRSLIFFLATLAWILFIFLYDTKLHAWQPLVLLGIYAVYLLSFGVDSLFKRFSRKRVSQEKPRAYDVVEKADVIKKDDIVNAICGGEKGLHIIRIDTFSTSLDSSRSASPGMTSESSLDSPSSVFEGDDVEEFETAQEEAAEARGEALVVVHHKVVRTGKLRRRAKKMLKRLPLHSTRDVIADLWSRLRPFADLDEEERAEKDRLSRIFSYLLLPVSIALRLTIPLGEASWSKPLAALHVLLCPQLILFALHHFGTTPIPGGPSLFVYVLAGSLIVLIPVMLLTSSETSPKYYKVLYAYAGLVMAVAWIYTVSTEVVGVVTMLGFVSRIQPAVLGLTIVAWSNCLGDAITDMAVARQGYPRMAHAATIAGPLFNLLIGFGLPFSISALQGDLITVSFDGVNLILIAFLGISLIFSSVFLVLGRAQLTRLYGVISMLIYLAFLLLVVLTACGLIDF